MRVEFVKKGNDTKDLSIGKIYEVISISIIPDSEDSELSFVKYRVLGEDGLIGLYSKKYFKILDFEPEPDWVFKINKNGLIEILPELISYQSFWNDFFDDEPNAIMIFKKRFSHLKDYLF
jgi:hypothetical protein